MSIYGQPKYRKPDPHAARYGGTHLLGADSIPSVRCEYADENGPLSCSHWATFQVEWTWPRADYTFACAEHLASVLEPHVVSEVFALEDAMLLPGDTERAEDAYPVD